MLADIHQTMDRLARHVTGLTTAQGPAMAETRPMPAGFPATDSAQRRPDLSSDHAAGFQDEEPLSRLNRTRHAEARVAEARGMEARAAEERAARVELDPADMLIEPGFGRGQQPGRAEPRFDRNADGVESPDAALTRPTLPAGPGDAEGPASFIAAARRAARAAQASAATSASVKAVDRRPSSETGPVAGTSTLTRAKAFLAQRRRPILLSVAALVLLVGALEVVKLSIDEPASEPRRITGNHPRHGTVAGGEPPRHCAASGSRIDLQSRSDRGGARDRDVFGSSGRPFYSGAEPSSASPLLSEV